MTAAVRAAPLVGRFDRKVAQGVLARRGLLTRLAGWGRDQRDAGRPLAWFHAPSVGEGLQAKPVIEAVRNSRPAWQLAYTFFSPSAERLARSLPVDLADYLPFDRRRDVRAALATLQPTALIFSKLDLWPELALAAAARGVRLGLISATVSETSSRLRWPVRRWAAPAYAALHRIGAISAEDGDRLVALGARRESIVVTGDTRYDSVAERAERFDPSREPFARLAAVPAGTFTIVAGSTWPQDEAVILTAFASLRAQVRHARLLLAPHEPNPDHLAQVARAAAEAGLPRPVRLSQIEHVESTAPLVLVDRVGILADLYGLGDVAFVGGGYHRSGLHSVLEPAVFGLPVTFGPGWRMSRDAGLLLDRKAAVALPPAPDGQAALLGQLLVWHHDPGTRASIGAAGRAVVEAGRGAADRTTALVQELVERAS